MAGKGFTLLELLVATAITAILAALAMPLYDNYKKQVTAADAQSIITEVSVLQESFFKEYRRYASHKELGLYGLSKTGENISLGLSNTETTYMATITICYKGGSCIDEMYRIDQAGNKEMLKKNGVPADAPSESAETRAGSTTYIGGLL